MNPIKNLLQQQQKTGTKIGTLGQQAKQNNSQKFGLINLVYSLILVTWLILFRLQPQPLARTFVIIFYQMFSLLASLLLIFIWGILDLKNLADSKPKQNPSNP